MGGQRPDRCETPLTKRLFQSTARASGERKGPRGHPRGSARCRQVRKCRHSLSIHPSKRPLLWTEPTRAGPSSACCSLAEGSAEAALVSERLRARRSGEPAKLLHWKGHAQCLTFSGSITQARLKAAQELLEQREAEEKARARGFASKTKGGAVTTAAVGSGTTEAAPTAARGAGDERKQRADASAADAGRGQVTNGTAAGCPQTGSCDNDAARLQGNGSDAPAAGPASAPASAVAAVSDPQHLKARATTRLPSPGQTAAYLSDTKNAPLCRSPPRDCSAADQS